MVQPQPMPGDIVLVDDRSGCSHCSDFAEHWDSIGADFPDTMIHVDAKRYPSQMGRFVRSCGGIVPTVMIVSDSPQQKSDRATSSALVRFITKSSENGHTPDVFVGNIQELARRVGDSRTRKELSQLHEALQNERDLANAIQRTQTLIGGRAAAPPVVKHEIQDVKTADLAPATHVDISVPPPPQEATPPTALASILDHLSIEEDGSYDGSIVY